MSGSVKCCFRPTFPVRSYKFCWLAISSHCTPKSELGREMRETCMSMCTNRSYNGSTIVYAHAQAGSSPNSCSTVPCSPEAALSHKSLKDGANAVQRSAEAGRRGTTRLFLTSALGSRCGTTLFFSPLTSLVKTYIKNFAVLCQTQILVRCKIFRPEVSWGQSSSCSSSILLVCNNFIHRSS